MIDQEAFNGFCSQAAEGQPIRALFITPSGVVRDMQKLDMFATANSRGLNALWLANSSRIRINEAEAYLRVAHGYLDREMQGKEFHYINGLEYFDGDEAGREVQNYLKTLVRNHDDV